MGSTPIKTGTNTGRTHDLPPLLRRVLHRAVHQRARMVAFVEQWSLSELTVELGTSCHAGALML